MRTKLQRGPIESAWGATPPVEIVPETTEDDDFEERAVKWLHYYFPPEGGFRTHCNRAWPLPDNRHLRPDIVTVIANTEIVVFVGDAKRHKRLQKRSVEKVLKYLQATEADSAAVFVPSKCNVDKTADAFAKEHNIDIVEIE